MTIEATAVALAAGEAQEAEQVATEAPAEVSEFDELSSVWDAAQSDDAPVKQEEAAQEAEELEATDSEADAEDEPDTASEEPEKAEEVEAPSDLPKNLRDAWKDMPESAREAVVESHRKLNRMLSEQGRMVQGIKPIQDVLVQAVKDLPSLANMRPDQVAQEVMQLAKMSHDFSARPVETMLGLIRQHKLEEPLRQALSGQRPDQTSMQNNELRQEVQRLQRQLAQVANPEYLREQVAQFTTQTQVEQSVEQFAQTAEHWDRVEQHMPYAIQFIKASAPDASTSDVLARAYDLAVSQFVPEAKKATQHGTAEPKAIPAADPEKTQAARKAKSVNVKSTSTGQRRQLSEAEELARVWDKTMNA